MYLLEAVINLTFSELLTQSIEFITYPPILIPAILIGIVGIAGQWSLYVKCNLQGIACIIPVWNVLEFLKVMGRPASHGIIVMAPPPIILYLLMAGPFSVTINLALVGLFGLIWALFMVKIYVELCQAFGKRSMVSYILCIALNGLYVMYLGISDETEYEGPVYGSAAKVEEA